MADFRWKPVTVAVIVLSMVTHAAFGVTLPNGESTQKYVDSLIKLFEKDSQYFKHCPIIHPPLPPPGNPKEEYFLPKVMLWGPQEQFKVSITCPKHGCKLKPVDWTSDVSGKGGQDARLMYDFMGNVILVQRIYLCTNGRHGHKMRATTPDIHNSLPRNIQEFFPAEIYQRCGITKTLNHFIDTEILEGVNFLKISEGLASLNYRGYVQRRLIYQSSSNGHDGVQLLDSEQFHNNVLYSFPSNDQIMRIFLHNFEKNKSIYVKAMSGLTLTSLSCDHTFKISRNVGLVREIDKKFVTQFQQLFIGLNELGQVVAWRLTKSTAFGEIEDLLVSLERRNSESGNKLELVCVDDCCHVANKYHSIFPNATVKLDLFHACQRITRTFSRQNALHKDITKDFVQVFRQDDDLGEKRTKNTADKEKIEKNLNSFVDRWSNIPYSPITEATYSEIKNLQEHVRKGCLSGIPPGCGTERNEGLHRLLNRSMISGATRLSVELAIALLTVLFYHHNQKILAENHCCSSKVKPVAPIDKSETASLSCPDENVPLKAGAMGEGSNDAECIGSPVDSSLLANPVIVMAENINDLCQESVAAAIISATLNLQELVQNVAKRCSDRSFDALDIIYLNRMTKLLCTEFNEDSDDPTINSHFDTLRRHLASFNLELDTIDPDGDCAFRSIVRQVSKLAQEEPGLVCEHLQTLGLLKGEDQDTLTLRKLFVDAVLADNCGISNFIQGSREELVGKAIEFQTRGFFDQEIGDVVIRVCSNLLRIAIMVVTSSTTIPFLSFHCDQPLTNSPVFVAYHYYGAGHYDATESLKKDPVEPKPGPNEVKDSVSGVCHCGRKAKSRSERFCLTDATSRCPCVGRKVCCQAKCRCLNCNNREKIDRKMSCRCGEGKSNKQNPEGKSCTDETGKRRTRCPCYSNGQPCSSLCSCKECGNKYGIRKPCGVPDTTVSRKKRMTSSPQSLKRERTTTFLEKTGFKVQSGPWTMEETCLLDTVESFLSVTCIVPNYKNITTLFNFVVNGKCVSDLQLAAVKKTERQIQAKLDFVRKRETALQNLYYGVSALGN